MSTTVSSTMNLSGPEDITDIPAGVGEAAPKATRRARAIKTAGIWLAPAMIGLLALLFYLYYRNLEETANSTVISALDWSTKLVPQTQRIIYIAFWSTLIVILLAVPLGIVLTRPALRRISPYVLAVANSGQALPAYGLLVIFLGIMGQGASTVIVALSLYALLPVLRNTMVGLDGVDRSVIEAGRGMGMTKMQVLVRIELPLAVPIILAGMQDRDDPQHRHGHPGVPDRRRRAGHHHPDGPEAQPGPDPDRRRLAGRPRGPHLRLAGRGGGTLPQATRPLSANHSIR